MLFSGYDTARCPGASETGRITCKIKRGRRDDFKNRNVLRQIESGAERNREESHTGRTFCIMARARGSLTFGDSYTCTYCLQVIKWDHHRTRPTKDHFFPKSKKKMLMGAKPIFVICCQPCNSRKSDKVFSSIEEVREFIRSRKALRCNIDGN